MELYDIAIGHEFYWPMYQRTALALRPNGGAYRRPLTAQPAELIELP